MKYKLLSVEVKGRNVHIKAQLPVLVFKELTGFPQPTSLILSCTALFAMWYQTRPSALP